jgi:hypothetical protein
LKRTTKTTQPRVKDREYSSRLYQRNSKKIKNSNIYLCLSICKFLTTSLSGHYLAKFIPEKEGYFIFSPWPSADNQWERCSKTFAFVGKLYGHNREEIVNKMKIIIV